jgi:hypothetical protein
MIQCLYIEKRGIKFMKKPLTILLIIALSLSMFIVVAIAEQTPEHPTPDGYNDNDYQKLVSFALQSENLIKLKWDLDNPSSWEGIT